MPPRSQDTNADELRIHVGSVAPTSPREGLLWYDTGASAEKVYVNGAWVLSGSGGGGLANIVEDLSPQLGANLDTNDKFIVNSLSGIVAIKLGSDDGSTFFGVFDSTGSLLFKVLDQGNLIVTGTVDGRDVDADGTKLDTIATNANDYSHPNHTGDVTSTGDGATAIAAGVIVNADVKSDAAIALTKLATGTNRQVLGANSTPANKMHTRLIPHTVEFDVPVEGDRRVLGSIGSASTMVAIQAMVNAGSVIFNVETVTLAQLNTSGTDILTSDESAAGDWDITDMAVTALAERTYLVAVLGVVTSATKCWITTYHEIDVPT